MPADLLAGTGCAGQGSVLVAAVQTCMPTPSSAYFSRFCSSSVLLVDTFRLCVQVLRVQ
jgi:hypothetical protein